jgi:hypothetical protein
MLRPPALLALLLLTAGCIGAAPPPDASPPTLGASGGWALDCTLGAFEQARDAAWPHACAVRASHSDGYHQELWLGVNPTDAANVVIGAKEVDTGASADCVWNGVSYTKDGGRTWADLNIGGNYSDRAPTEPWFGYACNTDPMLAFSDNGDVHYGVEVYNFGFPTYDTPLRQKLGSAGLLGWKILLATSHDGGATWPDVITYQPDLVTVTDYSRMTISPATGSILEAINNLPGPCHVLASRDGGRSADPPVKVANPDPAYGGGCQVIAASPTGTVVVAPSGPTTYWLRSEDDGRTFLDGNVGFAYEPIGPFEENEFRTGTNFEVAYDLTDGPRAGTLYAIYADESDGDADILSRSSLDDGRTWTEPVRVHDASTNDQFMPNVAVAGDGSVHALFMDKRWDPANKLLDATWAVSLDGGATWTEQRVTARSFDGDLGQHQSGAPFVGDYIGLGAVGNTVWGAFPESTNGERTVVAAMRVVRS